MGEREIGMGKEKEREREKERQGWERKIERDNSGRERQGRKREEKEKIINTKKFMEFYLVVLHSAERSEARQWILARQVSCYNPLSCFNPVTVYFHFFKGWHLLHTVRCREYPLNDLMPNHLLQYLGAPLKHLIDIYDTWSENPV